MLSDPGDRSASLNFQTYFFPHKIVAFLGQGWECERLIDCNKKSRCLMTLLDMGLVPTMFL